MIRRAVAADVPALQALEVAAGARFRDVGMPEVADDEPPSPDVLLGGECWVVDEDGPVAYLLLVDVDGCTHVEQVSVHPSAAGRGLGRALLDVASERARRLGQPRVTLTTFRDVPWNAPYYARLGFTVLDVLGPGLAAVRAHEAALGLDRWPRVAMARAADTGPTLGG